MNRIRADRRVGILLAGVLLLTLVALGATVALPATDAALDAEPVELSAQAKDGMDVFRSEGCWYCHTQYVRETRVDGPSQALGPEHYEGLSPAMLGMERVGSDLTYAADRRPSVEALREHGYGRLSSKELEALTAYLLAER